MKRDKVEGLGAWSLSKERKMIPIRVFPLSLCLLLVANPLGIILLTACILSEFLSDLLL